MHPTESLHLPDRADYEADEAIAQLTDLPDAVTDTLADTAAWEARCEAWSLSVALGLAGADGWVRDALCAGADLTGGVW